MQARSMQVAKSRASAPSGFTFTQPADSGTMLKLRIALKQNNMDGLIDKLYDVSTPSSPNWRKFLSKGEVNFPP